MAISTENKVRLRSALISVFSKEGLDPVIRRLHELGVTLYSTGGTQTHIEALGIPVTAVETLTGYPSILDGRVKTLHPAIFGGLLARREPEHLEQLRQYDIPQIDCVIVDLYPFEATVAAGADEQAIIEKIDIGGVSLIRAAAKNHRDVAVVASRKSYPVFLDLLNEKDGVLEIADRRTLAREAFEVTAQYDTAIANWFNSGRDTPPSRFAGLPGMALRYGENPHQSGIFYGNIEQIFDKIGGKAISYNNLVDIDAAVQLIREFQDAAPTFAILKHTNACGVARRSTLLAAWQAALACDPVSAFGGIFITNVPVDSDTAREINKLFYEVLIAPDFSPDALELLAKKEQRILLKIKSFELPQRAFRSLLHGVAEQDADFKVETAADLTPATNRTPTPEETAQLLFAIKCCKHLKSNAIALVKNEQLIGMGCGQPSRVDALRQAIQKARAFGFDTQGAVMASDAFFPFPDCVEIGHEAGITAIVQPGGSIKDQDSVAAANQFDMAMVMTGFRHFKH